MSNAILSPYQRLQDQSRFTSKTAAGSSRNFLRPIGRTLARFLIVPANPHPCHPISSTYLGDLARMQTGADEYSFAAIHCRLTLRTESEPNLWWSGQMSLSRSREFTIWTSCAAWTDWWLQSTSVCTRNLLFSLALSQMLATLYYEARW